MTTPEVDDAEELIYFPELLKITLLKRSSAYDRMNPRSPRFDATFPRKIRYDGLRNVYWLKSEAIAWRHAQIMKSRTT